MLHAEVPLLRQPCPPGACECEREALLEAADADIRILKLTREEEKILIARIENIDSYDGLQRMIARLQDNLGVVLRITPSPNGVSTVMGMEIQLDERPGLCRKTRREIPAAMRRCLGQHKEIIYAILDKDGLFG